MSRRTIEQARKIAAQRAAARIRCLIRNIEFRKDLLEVRKKFLIDKNMEAYLGFLHKWDLRWFPHSLIMGDDRLPGTPQSYEKIITKEMAEYLHSPDPDKRFIILPAVVAHDPFDEYLEQHCDPEDNLPVPDHIPRRGRILNIRVDLSYPLDVLEKLILEELKVAAQRREQLHAQGVLPRDLERLHTNKIEFYLKVYDWAKAGLPYREIAQKLGSRKSTVQYAHVVAMRLIGGTKEMHKGPNPKAKQKVAPRDYTEKHFKECATCREAEHFKDRCAGFRSWAEDHLKPSFIPFEDLRSDGTPKEH